MKIGILSLVAVVLSWSTPAVGQQGSAKTRTKPVMYKCVDANGKTHYSDKTRPDCNGGLEMSRSGRVLEKPPQEKTPAGDSKVLALKSSNRAEQERVDRALMATYTTEGEIETARDRSLAIPLQGIKTTEARLGRAHNSMNDLKREADALASQKKPLPSTLTEEVELKQKEIAALESELAQRRTNAEDIRARFNRDQARFRELRAGVQ
ncbi:MAG: DUF4124 domain-containing protein [Burkholderiales bacterium]